MRACVGLVGSDAEVSIGRPSRVLSRAKIQRFVRCVRGAHDDPRALMESSGMADWLPLPALAPKKARDKQGEEDPFLRAEGDESTSPVVFAHVDELFRFGFLYV